MDGLRGRYTGRLCALMVLTASPALGAEVAQDVWRQIAANGEADVIVLRKPLQTLQPGIEAMSPFEVMANFSRKFHIPDEPSNWLSPLGEEGVIAVRLNKERLEQVQNDPQVRAIVPNRAHSPFVDEVAAIGGFTRMPNVVPNPVSIGDGSEAGRATIAILDTGFDLQHPFLRARVAGEACFSRHDPEKGIETLCTVRPGPLPGQTQVISSPGAAENCPDEIVGCAHGTHIAGIAVGNEVVDTRDGSRTISGLGRTFDALLIQVFSKIKFRAGCFPREAPCIKAFDSSLLEALDFVRQSEIARRSGGKGPRITAVVISLGSGKYTEPCDLADPLATPIAELRALGIGTFVASGNEGSANAIAGPACVSSAIAVGAATKQSTLWPGTNLGGKRRVDMIAVGSEVFSSLPGGSYGNESGTSQAAPAAAVAFSVLKEQFPLSTVDDLKNALVAAGKSLPLAPAAGSVPMLDVAAAYSHLRQLVVAAAPDDDVDATFSARVPQGFAPDEPVASATVAAQQASGRDILVELDDAVGTAAASEIERASQQIAQETEAGSVAAEAVGPRHVIVRTTNPIEGDQLVKTLERQLDRNVKVYFERAHEPLR